MRGAGATGGTAGAGQRLVHDFADRARAAATLRAAAETAIDLDRGGRRGVRDGVTHLMVGQNVAGADDHATELRLRVGKRRGSILEQSG